MRLSHKYIIYAFYCREAIGKILARGHSRVPIYSGNPKNIIGLLLVGDKILGHSQVLNVNHVCYYWLLAECKLVNLFQ